MEEGRRLENLSWRIWNRETLCCEQRPQHREEAAFEQQQRTSQTSTSKAIPELSSSVDSVASDEMEQRMQTSTSSQSLPMQINGLSSYRSSSSALAGSARPISSFALEKMFISIKAKTDPKERLPPSVIDAIPATCPPHPAVLAQHGSGLCASPEKACESPLVAQASPLRRNGLLSSHSSMSTALLSDASSPRSRRLNSDTSADSVSAASTVRGCVPNTSAPLPPATSSAIPAKSVTHAPPAAMKKKGMFSLGGSSNEDESSFDQKMLVRPQKSSLTTGPRQAGVKKTTSFKEEVEARVISNRSHEDEDVFESDDDESDDDEAAIEDEDEGDWEDSADEGGDEAAEQPLFKRIDSKPNLASRRSLLTNMLHESDRATAMADLAQLKPSRSQPQLQAALSTPPSPSPPAPCTTHLAAPSPSPRGTAPLPITTTLPSGAGPSAPLSPRTTRRNMLAAELTESLRGHLLHERAMKNRSLAASRLALARRHTATGALSQLDAFPRPDQAAAAAAAADADDPSWTRGVFDGALGEYHERGW